MAGRMPAVYNSSLQTEYSIGPKSMQDLLLEGETGYDIDMLNPSLIDLQLQGMVGPGEVKEPQGLSLHLTSQTLYYSAKRLAASANVPFRYC